MDQEIIIKRYFQAWIHKDSEELDQLFASDIEYIECYGPVYHGLDQIHQWFCDWNQQGSVLTWDIKKMIHQGHTTAVEWYFECDYNKVHSGFDGVSLIEFNNELKITSIKEFESKSQHNYPYGI